MKKKSLAIFLLASTVTVSGCLGTNDRIPESQDEAKEEALNLQKCSNMIIQIESGSASSAYIVQTSGSKGVGRVNVTWKLEDGRKVSKIASIENPRGVIELQSGMNGELKELSAQSIDCEGSPVDTYG